MKNNKNLYKRISTNKKLEKLQVKKNQPQLQASLYNLHYYSKRVIILANIQQQK